MNRQGPRDGGNRPAPTWTTNPGLPRANGSIVTFEQCNMGDVPMAKIANLRINSYGIDVPKKGEIFQYELKFWAIYGPENQPATKVVDLSMITTEESRGQPEQENQAGGQTAQAGQQEGQAGGQAGQQEGQAGGKDRRNLREDNVRAQDRRQCITKLYDLLFTQHAAFFKANEVDADGNFKHVYAYDRSSIFFSSAQAQDNNGDPLIINLESVPKDIIGQLRRPRQIHATCKMTSILDLQNPDYTKLQVYLDVLLCQHQLDGINHIKYGTRMFNLVDKNAIDLGGCTLLNGHQKSVRHIYDNKDSVISTELQLDAKMSPFYSAVGLLDYLNYTFGFDQNTNLCANDVNNQLQLLKGVFVRTSHKENNEVFRIHQITKLNATEQTFELRDGNRQTVAVYFQNAYGNLQYPRFPCAVKKVGNNFSYFPLEVLQIQQGQKFPKSKMSSQQESEMIKKSLRPPQKLVQAIQSEKRDAGIVDDNIYLATANVRVAQNMGPVKAQILQAPIITYTKSHKVINFAEWDVKQDMFVKPAAYQGIVIFCYRVNQQDARGFAEFLFRRASELGMSISNNWDLCELKDHDIDYQTLANKIIKFKEEFSVDYCFFLGDCPGFHDAIKATEPTTGVPTQQIMPRTVQNVVQKRQMMTATNIIFKMNLKRGGINQYFQQNALTQLDGQQIDVLQSFLKGTMVMGLDFSHPLGGGESNRPSVLGYSYSLTDHGNVARGGFVYIESRRRNLDMEDLRLPFASALKHYKDTNQKLPQRILIYRSGISEGELARAYHDECESMGKVLNDLYDKGMALPHVIVVGCIRFHNSRLFKQDNDINPNDRAPQQNVPPGSAVEGYTPDETIMVPHRALQGTVKPTIFKTLFDSQKEKKILSKKVLDNVSHALCYMHEIVSHAISGPAHLRSAEDTAKRGHNLWVSRSSNENFSGGNSMYATATESLNPKIDTRYWA